MPARKRELIEPHARDKRYVRRDDAGRISEVDDVGRSLGRDMRKAAQAISHRGQGDRGDGRDRRDRPGPEERRL